jgi:dihydroorotate dehydrogenase (fumarate)
MGIMATSTKIAGIGLDTYVCNASGPLDSTLEELETLAKSGSSTIVMKSCTIEPRMGNPEPRYKRIPLGCIQSMGLPNLGYREYVRFASLLKRCGKPVVASVAGLSIEDYIVMVEAFQDSEADLIEVNLSCPNLEGKPQVGYDFEQTEMVLGSISGKGSKPLGLKLPPYHDFVHYERMAGLIERYGIGFITCINSVGNTMVIDAETEMPIIRPKRGFGGLCGEYIKPIALGNVRAFYELLRGEVSIFGVGGVRTGRDAFEFLLAGADAVQVGTMFEREGPACFARINHELEEILDRKGYASIEEAKGKLKYI